MKILVTGGAGFVGSNLCEKLIENHEVHSLDNYSIGNVKNHIEGVNYVNGDVVEIFNILENDFSKS